MKIWLVPGLGDSGLGLVRKTSLSRGGAFVEEQIFLFPLPVEKLHTEFVWKMNSFPCCLCWMLYWDKVQRYHSTFFWHQKFPLVFFPLSDPCKAGKHTHGCVGPPVCSLPWNCHGALATKLFCGKWGHQSVISHRFCEHVDLQSWSLKIADHHGCVLLTVMSDVCSPQWGIQYRTHAITAYEMNMPFFSKVWMMCGRSMLWWLEI